MAALLLRLLYNLFPQIDWGFVFVDDFCWLLRLPTGPQFTRGSSGHTSGTGHASQLEEDSPGRDQYMAPVHDSPGPSSSPDGGPKAHQGHGTPGGTRQRSPHVSKSH